jgi:hypothetical protein
MILILSSPFFLILFAPSLNHFTCQDGMVIRIYVGKKEFYIKIPLSPCTSLAQMSPNVPVVYDGLATRMSKCGAFAGLAKSGGAEPHKGRSSA